MEGDLTNSFYVKIMKEIFLHIEPILLHNIKGTTFFIFLWFIFISVVKTFITMSHVYESCILYTQQSCI